MRHDKGRANKRRESHSLGMNEAEQSRYAEWAARGNYGYYYYRGLYEGLESWLLGRKNDKGTDTIEKRAKLFLENNSTNNMLVKEHFMRSVSFMSGKAKMCGFILKTTYPGLLIGAGYGHGLSDESDFKLGFAFDYTTGLPIIPGSSVKGVLRSAFGAGHNKNEKLRSQKQEYVAKKLRQMGVEATRDEVEKLEKAIFDGIAGGTQLPLAARDVFFDAWPVKRETTSGGRLFYDDYVTPHIRDGRDRNGEYFIEEDSALDNPTPVRFLKVAPNVTYEFCFLLTETTLGDIKVSVEIKLGLFKDILKDMGMGAKTRVGYGYFREV
ncbi:MAG TPA: type III-B CRISPR module RAMP protein Cmr6 [Syntrophothermus lipocalidus]|nr:type III-B CRISPR module RAMP protein Cmr6 [Syntrophothermus lipocalidus]